MNLKLTLACWLLLCSGSAWAKPNEPLNVAWPYARALGIKQGEYSLERPARVTAETWVAPEGGWTFEKAKALANLMMNAKKPKRVHRPSPEYTVLNYPNGAVALKLEGGKIVSLTGLASDWDENNDYLEFTYRIKGAFTYVNDTLQVTNMMYIKLRPGMTHGEVVSALDGNYGEEISDMQFGEHRISSYVYKNFIGSFMTLTFQDNVLTGKQQVGLD
jgi:hypothetical protein